MKVPLKWHNKPGKKGLFIKYYWRKEQRDGRSKPHTIPVGIVACTFFDNLSPRNTFTVETRFKKGPWDWRNLFAIMRLRYIKVLFHIFYYYWVKLIATYNQDFVIQRFVISRFHCIWSKVTPARR